MAISKSGAYDGPLHPNGVVTAFPFSNFQVRSASEVGVIIDAAVVSPALYSVALNGDGTGTVNFLVAPTGTDLFVYSNPVFTDATNFTAQGPYTQTDLTIAIDRATIRAIVLNDRLLRTVRFKIGSAPAELPMTPNRVIGLDALGAMTLYAKSDFTGPAGASYAVTLTGDVTGTGTGGVATTIANKAVSNAKMADVATGTFKGRISALTGAPEDLTGTQATSLLVAVVGDTGSGGTKGLAPAPGAGDAAAGKFLKADGTWAIPAGGGAGTTTNALTVNNGGAGAASGSTFNGASALTISYNTFGAAPLASPAFTGVPTAPTPTLSDNNTNIATTAFVKGQGYSPLASPTFTGTPAAPTPSVGDSTTKIATTAFVQGEKNPAVQTVASNATVTPTFTNDLVDVTAQAAAINFANWTGTAANGWTLVIRLKDNGIARAITYGTNYLAIDGLTLPTTTIVGKTHEFTLSHNATTGKHMMTSAITY